VGSIAEAGSIRRWLSRRRCGGELGREERLTESSRARVSLPTPGKPFRRRRNGGGVVTLMSKLVSWLDKTAGASGVVVAGSCNSAGILLCWLGFVTCSLLGNWFVLHCR